MPEQRDDGEHSDSKGTMLPACEGLRLATRGERSDGVEAEGAAGARGGAARMGRGVVGTQSGLRLSPRAGGRPALSEI